MTPGVSSFSNAPSVQQKIPLQQPQKSRDSDGDFDASKPGEVEKAESKGITATLGNNINTTA